MKRLSSLRYFAAVAAPARPLVVVFAALAATAVVLEIFDPGSSDWVVASIVLLQMFAASTGFTHRATRGYFDPVLVLPGGRPRLALAHFAASAAPGAAAWFVAAAAQSVAARTLDTPAFRPAGLAALLLVSAIAWAVGARAPAYTAGALWLLLSGALFFSGKTMKLLGAIHADPEWAGDHPLQALIAAIAMPGVIPALRWPPSLLLAFALVSCGAIAAGIALIARAEFPLAEEGG